MGKKKHKHPEHVNLERYLISYADFITLLFATFVVLYALSQVDIKDFKALENSIQQAFSAPSIMQGDNGVMPSSSGILDNVSTDSMITPLMMEYVSQRYENDAMEDIASDIEAESKAGEIDGVEVLKNDKGLVIRMSDDYLFKSGSATLTPAAKVKLDKVGAIIGKKFYLHTMRVEGNTDSKPMSSAMFPSNWELSSARASAIIRYFIARFTFVPSLFTAIGYADTRPIADNKTEANRAKNRRVEILILKSRFNSIENPQNDILKMSKEDQEKMQVTRMNVIKGIDSLSETAKKLAAERNKRDEANARVLNQVYDKEIQRLNKETQAMDNVTKSKITGQGSWLKPPGSQIPASQINQIKVFN